MSKKREERKDGGAQADDGDRDLVRTLAWEQGAREKAKQGRPMTGRRRPSGCGAFLASDGRSGGLLEHLYCTVGAD